jgi:hypothetical protein
MTEPAVPPITAPTILLGGDPMTALRPSVTVAERDRDASASAPPLSAPSDPGGGDGDRHQHGCGESCYRSNDCATGCHTSNTSDRSTPTLSYRGESWPRWGRRLLDVGDRGTRKQWHDEEAGCDKDEQNDESG